MVRAGRLEVAAGDGVLARRHDALLFVARPLGSATPWATVLDAFLGASDTDTALATVLDHAVDQHLEVGPFAVVVWTTAAHLVVFGDLTITTDLSSVPRLSGAGMPTWVEHRATRLRELAEVRLGDPVVAGTDLAAGIVPAGGFRLTLHSPSIQPVPDRPPDSSATSVPTAPAPEPPRPAAPTPPAGPPPTAAPVADATTTIPPPLAALAPAVNEPHQPTTSAAPPDPAMAPPAGAPSSWDVLRDVGGAWMDDSLQLTEPRRPAAAPAAAPVTAPPVPPLPDERRPTPEPGSPPTTFDPEVTLDAGALGTNAPAAPTTAPSEPGPFSRYVQARRCEFGHLNPPLRTRCRTCDQYLPPATPVETVPQPALATLVLGDGRTVDVAGPVVLGRTPSADAARLDEPGTLVTVGDATVSRTHAVVNVDGWTLLATDCAATGGTAIAKSGGDPALLEPWVPHELSIGDTLFLGGPTQVQVVARRD